MVTVKDRLEEYRDEDYAQFQTKLVPGIPCERMLGVRLPDLRAFARTFAREDTTPFLEALPHAYYDEDLLHAILLSKGKDYEKTLERVNRFLPYVNNWAVCDTLSPKCFEKHKEEVLREIPGWIRSEHEYTCRFGMDVLMSLFLEESFQKDYLELPASVHRPEYYVNMMIAWFFATALAKQWEAAIPYLEERRLDPWIHRKTIQKAKESYRITDEQKAYLNTLK